MLFYAKQMGDLQSLVEGASLLFPYFSFCFLESLYSLSPFLAFFSLSHLPASLLDSLPKFTYPSRYYPDTFLTWKFTVAAKCHWLQIWILHAIGSKCLDSSCCSGVGGQLYDWILMRLCSPIEGITSIWVVIGKCEFCFVRDAKWLWMR